MNVHNNNRQTLLLLLLLLFLSFTNDQHGRVNFDENLTYGNAESHTSMINTVVVIQSWYCKSFGREVQGLPTHFKRIYMDFFKFLTAIIII